ncbi:binding-protein-dependent transport systems inner membrane component [Paenibacillus vortex V453]|uniref:Peptide ABC transporter permease n=2 Tax=Paenibacillus TaxID=44249 RepID=A0A163MCA5_9BACL|nr:MULTISPECIES: ABC transporter permease [Paenibacillus]MCA4750934.1 ABC transporter permease [Mycolicibacterium fortuitum]AVV58429.1 ABC transporter permease [Paenibacillus glucanolyticus]EFU40647.1 binding-protein-dependent transport systems inner membrane component [Paenibacillus vortex V453]ETT40313.1 binding-protein-dependent transport systems inner membrane component [Paenibacillus sp. FSL R5-808]KZS48927.1 peptide ABC transporter permease [Paenibacillus glucanolyticus]
MRFYIRKLIMLAATVLLVSVITFLVFQVLPGDPAQIILGVDADPHQLAALRDTMGLDRPVGERYVAWIKNAAVGDLGESLRYHRPVTEILAERVPVTVSLALFSLALTLLIGIPLGILIARYDGKWPAVWLSAFTQLGVAMPSFWLAFILILVFSVTFRLFPTYGYVPWGENPIAAIRSLFLPSLALSIPGIAVVMRYLRNTLLDQTRMDYVRTARSKGVRERAIMYRHILRNALIPVVTIVGLIITDTLGGSIVVENVFALPGLGNLLITSIGTRDLPLVQTLVLYIAILVAGINFIIDLLYKVIDPRIRIKR